LIAHIPLGITALSLLTGYTTAVSATASPILIHQSPLFLTTSEKANVLVILDNSNSMDEAANGSAVGSDDPNSKSEIARTLKIRETER
jgi:type IV pilus assembly protein PilY1